MTLPYIMSKDSITIMVNGATTTVQDSHLNFVALRDAIRNGEWDLVPELITPAKAVEQFAQGRIEIQNGEVMLDGAVVHNAVTTRILDMVREGFDAEPLMRFLENLMRNPSKVAVDELYLWLEGTRLPITEDGHFMAYKKVNSAYLDFYTGKVLNKPAALMTDADLEYIRTPQKGVQVEVQAGVTVVHMPRNQVDDRRDRTCSQGLHFCSLSYLPAYHGGQGRVLLVKIDPADVVSIPSDYDNAKGRAWRYQVVGEHIMDETTEAYTTSVVNAQGEPMPSVTESRGQEQNKTWVMGVNFGTPERAAQVRALMDVCATRDGASVVDVSHARVHGFDDAWAQKAPDLSGYSGNHMREAVEYAQAYFEGYDRCSGVAPQVQATVTEPRTAADDYYPANAAQRDEILRVLATPYTGRERMKDLEDAYDQGVIDAETDLDLMYDFNLNNAIMYAPDARPEYIRAYVDTYNQDDDDC
jgi:hypothetical protein